MATRHSRRLQNRSPSPVTGPVSDHDYPPDSDRAPSDSDPALTDSEPFHLSSDSDSDHASLGTLPPLPVTIPQQQPKPLPPVPPNTAPDPDSSSDSSSDSELETKPTRSLKMPNAVVTHSNVTRPPQMSDGTVSPGTIQEFEQCAECFFLNAKGGIKDDQKVLRLLGCFANPLIRDWIAGKRTELAALSFPDFMKTFRKRWLPSNWEEVTKTKMLGSRMEPDDKFENWVVKIQKLNVALRGTNSYCDDDQLRTHLALNLDSDLRSKTERARTSQYKDLSTWIEHVTEIDRERHQDKKRLNDHLENFMRSHKRPFVPSRSYNSPDTSAKTTVSTSTSSSPPFPPRLTEDERRLLQEHDGCFKCRTFYAGHRQAECNISVSGKGYKPLTVQDALRAKSQKTSRRTTTVGVVSDAAPPPPSESPKVVAAVFPDFDDDDELSFSDPFDDSLPSVSVPPPLKCKHLTWKCALTGPAGSFPVNALIDSGAHMVLIQSALVHKLQLPVFPLSTPELVNVAITSNTSTPPLSHYVILSPASRRDTFRSHPLHAVVTDDLAVPLILGLPFLIANKVTCNYAKNECLVKFENKLVNLLDKEKTKPTRSVTANPDILAAIHERARLPAPDHVLLEHEETLRELFKTVFEPLPHADELPKQPVARIKLKDPDSSIKTRNYPCPRKWKEAWHTLLQQHLDAGRIRPSDAPAGSGAFIIPKADPTVLPRWVNDYRQLNTNTVTDSFPLPRISEILSDCGSGKFFASIDMTNSFFQTRMHPDDVKLTAVNTPWGLYEWVVMPMGIKNAPAIHQRRVTAALRPFIGRICHVYLDDIVIWSKTIDIHLQNVTTVLNALREHKLYCNPKKTKLFCTEIRFLGHRISSTGIEADEGKADRVTNWPTPSSAKHVRSFLGLVRYLNIFLPNLAKHTGVLDELTRKECDKDFPPWTPRHQAAFDQIKHLVTSSECLTTIDPALMPEYKIFVTTDASDFGSGAVLSFGPTYDKARPVAYDSRTFKGAELNYPVHEKEQLAIIRALAKWRTDLLGHKFEVWTDHRTLEHLNTQRDLSRRQARWLEFLSQYDVTIHYIPGDKNNAADALSRLPDTGLSASATLVGATLQKRVHSRFHLEDSLLDAIRSGYVDDPFTAKLSNAATGMHNVSHENGFWFVDGRLFVPNVKHIRELLFRLAHDKLGHFGVPKSLHVLRDSFYWPKMRRDLERAYIPSCADCQRNKSRTTKPFGPLHPLPVPDRRCDSVAIDFIGPLPLDDGYDCILTLTDRLGSDIRLVPTTCSLTAQGLAELFFREWYCENGLPLEIVSDRDKLFVSHFWKALHKLTGVKLKMSSSFHPETDGASERSNKTVIQCVRFAVERDQRGWAQALPKVRFDIMNTINMSTGYTPFQLRFGKSPRILPPILTSPPDDNPAVAAAEDHIKRMLPIELDARDNLLTAKISQAHFQNQHRRATFPFKVGDRVVLSTANRRAEYKSQDNLRVAKFMPRYDGPYAITATDELHSTVTLHLPHLPHAFPVFHTSEVQPFQENDDDLFPHRALHPPAPILRNGEQEFFIDKIVDERRRAKQIQYRIRWQGEGPEGDKWLPASEVEDCEALDIWLARNKAARQRRKK